MRGRRRVRARRMLTDSRHRSSSLTRPRNRRHPSGTNHILQLFDTRESLARSVASFLLAGLNQGQMLLVVAIPTHWRAVASELRAFGVDPEALQRTGGLTVRDAEATLGTFMRQGKPRRAPFAQSVGNEVVRLAS